MRALLAVLSLLAAAPVSLHAGIAVIGNLARHHHVLPGDEFEGVILVRNTGTEPLDVRVGQNDYLFSADGANHYEKAGSQPRSNAPWLTVTPTRASIEPMGTASVYYRGKVPATGTPVTGTYWSMVMIEPIATPQPMVSGAKEKITMGLQTVMRFGVQIVSEIGTTGTEELKIVAKNLVATEGKRFLQVDVANTGERLQIPALLTEVYNRDGGLVGRFEAGKSRIYPTCSVRFRVNLSDVPSGKYTAMVVMDTGADYVTGAQYTLEIAP